MAKARKVALRTYSVDDYIEHFQRYGPDEILETAAQEGFPDKELGRLKAFVESRLRTHRWKDGHGWQAIEQKIRVCEGCGLDLPPGSSKRRRFHSDTCRMKLVRQRANGHTTNHGDRQTRTRAAVA